MNDNPPTWLVFDLGGVLMNFDGALEYVRQLKADWPIACLSNTSITHWDRLRGNYGLDKLFEHTFLSFEIGLHKPDLRVFDHVAKSLKVAPEDIAYFDDRTDIVDAANRFGFKAHQVNSPEAIERVVRQFPG